jgi:hypothetical protein
MLTFEGVGGVEVDGSLLVDCQMRCSNMRRRRRSVVLGNLSSDHLLALWAKRALLFEEVRFAGCVGASVRRCSCSGRLAGCQAGRNLLLRQAMRCSSGDRRPTGRESEEAGVCQQQCLVICEVDRGRC